MIASGGLVHFPHPDDIPLLSAVASLCTSAGRFFQLAASQVSPGNLRYQFANLARLHVSASKQLPGHADAAALRQLCPPLSAVQYWYLQQHNKLQHQECSPAVLAELAILLPQQLAALKQLTRCSSHRLQAGLAHFTAALQLACDQLLPQLQVLPISRQKVQTKN
jgi:hypothetical protein